MYVKHSQSSQLVLYSPMMALISLHKDLSPLDFFFMFPPKHLTDLVHQTNVQRLHLCLKLNNTSERDVKVSISRVMTLTTKFEFTTRAVIIVVQYNGKMRY
jgi:hypothetical protein